jgi:hypothetical protein
MTFDEELRGPLGSELRQSLDSLRRASEAIWDPAAPRLIKNFTDHGPAHSNRVVEAASKLVRANRDKPLSEQELYLLIAAAYLHDIGMQCDVRRFPAVREEAEKLGASFAYGFGVSGSNDFSHDDQQALRGNHHYLSAAWIAHARVTGTTELGAAIKTIPTNLVEDLMDVCMYHSKLRIADCEGRFQVDRTQRKRLVAALLRIADELDIESTRARLSVVKSFAISADSALYWWLHNCTKITFVSENTIEIDVILHPDDATKHGRKLKTRIIDEFQRKNKPVLEVLRDEGFPVYIASDSDVIKQRFQEPLPAEIVAELDSTLMAGMHSLAATWDLPSLGDARSAGSAVALTSYSRVLLSQLGESGPANFVIVDVGHGNNWLVSRLYLFATILERTRSLRCIAFFGQTRDRNSQFLGLADPRAVREALANRHPYLWEALAVAYASAERSSPNQTARQPLAWTAELAERIIPTFLLAVQSNQTDDPSDQTARYVMLPKQSYEPVTWERAEWLTTDSVESLLEGSLRKASVQKSALDPETLTSYEQVLLMDGDFVAVLNETGGFEGLIDRREFVENLARRMVQRLLTLPVDQAAGLSFGIGHGSRQF